MFIDARCFRPPPQVEIVDHLCSKILGQKDLCRLAVHGVPLDIGQASEFGGRVGRAHAGEPRLSRGSYKGLEKGL